MLEKKWTGNEKGPKKLGRGGKWDGVSRWKNWPRCREFARSLKLNSRKEWEIWCRDSRPLDVPSAPPKAYKEAWMGWGDFLGTGE